MFPTAVGYCIIYIPTIYADKIYQLKRLDIKSFEATVRDIVDRDEWETSIELQREYQQGQDQYDSERQLFRAGSSQRDISGCEFLLYSILYKFLISIFF